MERSTSLSHAFAGAEWRSDGPRVLGVMPGEGVGGEVVAAALTVLDALPPALAPALDIRTGGLGTPGVEAAPEGVLEDAVADFFGAVFESGGVVLSGPAAGRFVYDLRRRFDLFCKLVPLRGLPELAEVSGLKRCAVDGVDILLVRENTAGLYQSESSLTNGGAGRVAEQRCIYREPEVDRIVTVAARLAQHRRGNLTVVLKDGGAPALSALWRDVAERVTSEVEVDCRYLNIDLAAFELIHRPRELDVIVAPNLFGDILADLGAVFLGSRGSSFSGNFAANGAAVYQTNHGSARDIAGTDRANPVGQIFSLAMLLRDSLGSSGAADLIERAVRSVWEQGWRTADLATNGARIIGTKEMTRRIAEAVAELSG